MRNLILILALTATLGIRASAAGNPATTLEELRDTAQARLSERWQADLARGPALDLVVRCDQAFGIHALALRLPWRGGAWQEPRIVSAPADVRIDAIDPGALQIRMEDGSVAAIEGHLVVRWTPRTLIERGGWLWQYQLQDEPDTYAPRQEHLVLRTDPSRNSTTYRLHAHAAVDGRDLEIVLRRRDGAWIDATAQAPQWNRASHVVDTESIRVGPDRNLQGRLDVTLLADRWVPEDGQPRPITLVPDTAIRSDGAIEGTYQVRGSMGDREGALTGTVNLELHGSFQFERDPPRGGRLQVTVETPDPERSAQLPSQPEDDDAASPLAHLRAALAYHLALVDYPRPVAETVGAVRVAAAEGDGDAMVENLRAWLATTVEAEVIRADLVDADPRFGPYHGEERLEIEDGRNQVPVADLDPVRPQRWQRATAWQVIGPFGVDAFPEAPMPEVVPSAAYPADALGWAATGDAVLRWEAADTIHRPAVPPAPDVLVSDWDHRSEAPRRTLTFATTTLDVAADDEYVIALHAPPHAVQMWVNRRRVEIPRPSEPRTRHHPLIVRLPLSAGPNELLLRVANDFEQTFADLWFCTAGAPHPERAAAHRASIPPPQHQGWRGENRQGRAPDADPPLVWDLESGFNVAWRRPVPTGLGGVTVSGNRAFVTADPDQLLALNLTDGEILWRVSGDGPADAGRTASTTPVATADRVWAWFGTGRALCADHEGALQWSVDSGLRARGTHLASPLLVNDLLILQGVDPDHDQVAVQALDAATGAPRWRRLLSADPIDFMTLTPRYDHRWYRDGRPGDGWGLASMRLHHGDRHRDVIITHDGALLDAEDGALLVRRLPVVDGNRSPPLVVDDSVYVSTNTGHAALDLWLEGDGRVGHRLRWLVRRRTFSGGGIPLRHSSSWPMSPLMVDGLLVCHRHDHGHRPRHRVRPFGGGDVVDPETGRWLATRFDLTHGSNPSLPMIHAGAWLFAGNSGQGCTMGFSLDHGELVAALPGLPPLPLMRNRIDPSFAAPVAVGRHLLVRGTGAVTAFAVDGEAGRQRQWELIAEDQMAQIPVRPPETEAPRIPATPGDFHTQDRLPVVDVQPGVCFSDWLVAGPVPPGAPVEPPQLGGIEGLPQAGEPLPGTDIAWRSLSPRDHTIMSTSYAPEFHWTTDRPRFDHRIDLIALLGGRPQPGTVLLMATVLSVPETLTASLATGAAGFQADDVAAWLGGRPVPLDTPLRLEAGSHALLLRVPIGRMPPFARVLHLKPHLVLSPDQEDTVQAWYDLVAERRPLLERIAAQDDNPHAAQAQRLVERLDQRE